MMFQRSTFNILFSMQILGCVRIFANFSNFYLNEIFTKKYNNSLGERYGSRNSCSCPVAFIFSYDFLFHYDFFITFSYFCRDIDLCSVKNVFMQILYRNYIFIEPFLSCKLLILNMMKYDSVKYLLLKVERYLSKPTSSLSGKKF